MTFLHGETFSILPASILQFMIFSISTIKHIAVLCACDITPPSSTYIRGVFARNPELEGSAGAR